MNALPTPHPDIPHRSHRAPWLRAAVLGMNDGTVSTASLMLGVLAASGDNTSAVLTAGVAGLVAGALSMAAGEYVSVSSQRDSELSDLEIEKKSLSENPKEELNELAWIYQKRGLSPQLAKEVAQQLHKHGALDAHARSELGIDSNDVANPLQAAIASASAFALGAVVPLLAAVFSSQGAGLWVISVVSLVALFVSGAVSAAIGGGSKLKASFRIFIGGGLAMVAAFSIGHLIGASL